MYRSVLEGVGDTCRVPYAISKLYVSGGAKTDRDNVAVGVDGGLVVTVEGQVIFPVLIQREQYQKSSLLRGFQVRGRQGA
jgi:hypothetical protein